jgi:hypothetical protein
MVIGSIPVERAIGDNILVNLTILMMNIVCRRAVIA